jgi:hypothetical protein
MALKVLNFLTQRVSKGGARLTVDAGNTKIDTDDICTGAEK